MRGGIERIWVLLPVLLLIFSLGEIGFNYLLFEFISTIAARSLVYVQMVLLAIYATIMLIYPARFIKRERNYNVEDIRTKIAIERYDIISNATSDTIWDWDIPNNKMMYNIGISKVFGYGDTEVVNIMDWWEEKIHPDDLSAVKSAVKDAFESNTSNFQFTYRFQCADGGYKDIYDRAFIIFDETGHALRMIGVMQDITLQKNEEHALNKAILEAQEQERNYVGLELHDNVNQILTASMLMLDVAADTSQPSDKIAELISESKSHIGMAINEIRKLSHQLAPAILDGDSLKEVFENLLSQIRISTELNIEFYYDEMCRCLEPDIQINLYRILQEQIKNILKHSQATSISINVACLDNKVQLKVRDNGIGLNPKTVKMGIGFNNMKRRVDTFGGKFIINSTIGQGCELEVDFPLVNSNPLPCKE